MLLSEKSKFIPAPEGQFRAVCVDFVDLGEVKTSWQGEERLTHKCRVVFEIEETQDDGRPFLVSQTFTASLSEKANLRKFLEQWRGRSFTPVELKAFETENLVGAQAVLQIVHNESQGTIYANINAVMKPMKGLAPLTPFGSYVRVKDRPATTAPTATVTSKPTPSTLTARTQPAAPIADPEWEEIPF